MIHYTRDIPHDVPEFDSVFLDNCIHVREHLSSCVDPNDSEKTHFSDVVLSYEDLGDRTRITGSLDVETADYALDALPVLPEEDEEVEDA